MEYYRWWLKRIAYTNRQLYPAHISVIRNEIFNSSSPGWGKYEGEKVEFEYDGIIRHGTLYYWINAYSLRLEEIRTEAGLSIKDKYNKVLPGTYSQTFHFSIGNIKL